MLTNKVDNVINQSMNQLARQQDGSGSSVVATAVFVTTVYQAFTPFLYTLVVTMANIFLRRTSVIHIFPGIV